MSLPVTISRERRARERRWVCVSGVLAVLTVVLAWLELTTGEIPLSFGEVARYLLGGEVSGAEFAVGELRLPRAIVGALAGAAFGMAGHASQTLLRNQLASPDIIGITYGASAAAVISILTLNWSGIRVTLVALPAGLLTAAVIFLLSTPGLATQLARSVFSWSWSRAVFAQAASVQGGRLILIGIGVAALLGSVIEYMQVRARIHNVSETLRWLSGSLSNSTWEHVPFLAVVAVVFGGVLLGQGRSLSLMAHGSECATGIGVNVGRTSVLAIVCVVGLSSAATAATGPIAFVSFLAGPLVTFFIGRCDRSMLVPAGLMGAVLVLGADLAGQTLFPYRMPVGLVTSLVGAPYLLLQLIRLNRVGASA